MNILRLSAFVSLLCFSCFTLAGEDSIWYSTNSLNISSLPSLPAGYLITDNQDTCSSIHAQNTLNLSDVANAALCNNPQTREVWANARAQAAQVGIAKSAYLPSVINTIGTNVNASSPRLVTRDNAYSNLNNSLVATYLLYDFGNRDAALENARQLLQAASATQSAAVQTILFAAVTNYYQVQASISALEAAITSETTAQESFKAAEARYQAGVTTPADKLQAQTAYAQATLTRITAEGALKSAYGSLANVMGLPANATLTLMPSQLNVEAVELNQDITTLINEAIARRPDLIASEAQVKAAEASILSSRAAAKPTVNLAMSNAWQDGSQLSSINTTTVGLNVTIPLFIGYAPSYRIQSALANADVKIAQRDRLKLQVSLDVWGAYQSLRTAIESVNASNALVRSAEESARVALGRYKAGVGNIIDTLSAQSALANAHQQIVQSTLNWNIARASLAQAIGGLDNAMILSLPQANVEH